MSNNSSFVGRLASIRLREENQSQIFQKIMEIDSICDLSPHHDLACDSIYLYFPQASLAQFYVSRKILGPPLEEENLLFIDLAYHEVLFTKTWQEKDCLLDFKNLEKHFHNNNLKSHTYQEALVELKLKKDKEDHNLLYKLNLYKKENAAFTVIHGKNEEYARLF